jgi:tRNA(Ile)-lysidine synthase
VCAAEPSAPPIANTELNSVFSLLKDFRRVVLAVSGGPDSTALLVLAQRWRAAQRSGPALLAATVDHRLRKESAKEAEEVARLATSLGVPHRTLIWSGRKPKSGLQNIAREARYRLIVAHARKVGADAIVTAHTLDDQAETFVMRLARGSGVSGLGGMRARSERDGVALLRPLLSVPKARLIATLHEAGVGYANDPSNSDPRFLRPRLRALGPALQQEGLVAERLALTAARLARADAALEAATDEAAISFKLPQLGPVELDARRFFRLADELGLRLLGRAIDRVGSEGPVELGKLEVLHAALKSGWEAGEAVKRTLAGAAATLAESRLRISRAPARRRPTRSQ